MKKNKLVLPKYYILEPSRKCNFRCFMCPYKDYSQEEKGVMALDNFHKIINEISPTAEIIQLYWMGEPLLNENIFTMIREIKEKTKAKLIISTNGYFLDKLACDKLVQSKLDSLIIDVDAACEETYKKIRIGGNYKKLIENIEYLLSINDSISINLQFLTFKFNEKEKQKFVKQWQGKKCKLVFSWIDTWAGQLSFLEKDGQELSPYIDEVRLPCSDLWYKMTINYKGDVNLCCHDYKGLYKIGNLLKDSVEQIWNNEEIKKIREQHELGKFEGLCANCIEWAKKEEYKELKDL